MSGRQQKDLIGSAPSQALDFFERRFSGQGCRLIAGVDEAGRGPLAGPVVAAAVILPFSAFQEGFWDSKKLQPEMRESLYEKILKVAVSIGTGVIEAEEIDQINIGRATQKAMAKAVRLLNRKPEMLLVDGSLPIPLPMPQRTIVKGDNLCVSIGAASIVAKVTRDRIMTSYHEKYPQYNFAKHKGYGTQEHLDAIRRHGYCEYHRKTFKGVKGSLPHSSTLSGQSGFIFDGS